MAEKKTLLKRASWVRRQFELWLMRRYMLRFGPQMIQRRGYWWYVGPEGYVWRLVPTGDPSSPLMIIAEDR